MKTNKNFFLFILLALSVSLVSVGCDSNDDDGDDFGDLIGDWQQVESDPDADLFLRIEQDRITVAATSPLLPDLGFCTSVDVNDFDIDNGTIRGTDTDGDAILSTFSVDGNELTLDGDTYVRTNDFPTCSTNV